MADFNEFVPALPFTLKWSLNDNPFDDSDANPKQMSIAIPVKSADAFCAHIYKMAADEIRKFGTLLQDRKRLVMLFTSTQKEKFPLTAKVVTGISTQEK